MKLRNHRKQEWLFFPPANSSMAKKCYSFQRKEKLMDFLSNNFINCINGIVSLSENGFGYRHTKRQWQVWYNQAAIVFCEANPKVVLIQLPFRNKRFISRLHKVSKSSKKYFAFSDKRINIMCSIKGIPTAQQAISLVNVFHKSGFKDFEPDADDLIYINGHICDGIDWFYWSDRCNILRMKTIITYLQIIYGDIIKIKMTVEWKKKDRYLKN